MGKGENILESVDAILSAQSEGKTVSVPEWGGSVVVRELTYNEVQKLVALTEGREAFVLVTAVVKPTFTDEQAQKVIDTKGNAGLARVLAVVMELSGLTPEFRAEQAT